MCHSNICRNLIGNFFLLILHSQIRKTAHPFSAKVFVTNLSLARFFFIFFCQYSALSFGFVLRQLCPCQKQPSAKTTIFFLGKTKSGFPKSLQFLLQPVILSALNSSMILISVDLLPRDFTFLIIEERSSFVNVSAFFLITSSYLSFILFFNMIF